MNETTILEMISGEVYAVWFLIGAALVFFMQCGFSWTSASAQFCFS